MCNSLLPMPNPGPGFEESDETSTPESPFGRSGLESNLVFFASLKIANLEVVTFHNTASFRQLYHLLHRKHRQPRK